MTIAEDIAAQFKQPHGLLGHVAGFIMAHRRSNIERNEWTLGLLGLRPTDYLLEVGFGPGIAIEKASQIITDGLIVGIDHSDTMFNHATKRNASAIRRGTVKLYWGSVDELPLFERRFNKICSANVVQFWQDPVAVFRNLRPRLTEGGIIATTYMPRHRGATDADAREKARSIERHLKAAGFSSICVEERRMKPVSVVSVLAVNGHA